MIMVDIDYSQYTKFYYIHEPNTIFQVEKKSNLKLNLKKKANVEGN